MNPIVRNVLAGFGGFFLGSALNMAIVSLGPLVVPAPPGVDVTDADALARSIHLFEPKHFLPPLLAHAFGTLAGCFAAYRLAVTRRALVACVVGAVFFAGGVAACFMIPAPTWFIALDLSAAYAPMSLLGVWLGRRGESVRRQHGA